MQNEVAKLRSDILKICPPALVSELPDANERALYLSELYWKNKLSKTNQKDFQYVRLALYRAIGIPTVEVARIFRTSEDEVNAASQWFKSISNIVTNGELKNFVSEDKREQRDNNAIIGAALALGYADWNANILSNGMTVETRSEQSFTPMKLSDISSNSDIADYVINDVYDQRDDIKESIENIVELTQQLLPSDDILTKLSNREEYDRLYEKLAKVVEKNYYIIYDGMNAFISDYMFECAVDLTLHRKLTDLKINLDLKDKSVNKVNIANPSSDYLQKINKTLMEAINIAKQQAVDPTQKFEWKPSNMTSMINAEMPGDSVIRRNYAHVNSYHQMVAETTCKVINELKKMKGRELSSVETFAVTSLTQYCYTQKAIELKIDETQEYSEEQDSSLLSEQQFVIRQAGHVNSEQRRDCISDMISMIKTFMPDDSFLRSLTTYGEVANLVTNLANNIEARLLTINGKCYCDLDDCTETVWYVITNKLNETGVVISEEVKEEVPQEVKNAHIEETLKDAIKQAKAGKFFPSAEFKELREMNKQSAESMNKSMGRKIIEAMQTNNVEADTIRNHYINGVGLHTLITEMTERILETLPLESRDRSIMSIRRMAAYDVFKMSVPILHEMSKDIDKEAVLQFKYQFAKGTMNVKDIVNKTNIPEDLVRYVLGTNGFDIVMQ